MSTLAKARNALPYTVLMSVFGLLLSFFGMVLLVRYLPINQYGILTLFLGIPALINTFFTFGDDHFIRRYVPSYNESNKISILVWRTIGKKILQTIILSTVQIVLFDIFSEKYGIENYFAIFAIYQIAIVSQVGSYYFLKVYHALFKQKYIMFIEVANHILKIILINFGIFKLYDIEYFLLAFTILATIRFLLEILLFSMIYSFPSDVKEIMGLSRSNEEKKYVNSTYVVGLGNSLLSTNNDKYILALASNNLQVAIYAIATTLLDKIMFILPIKMLRPLLETSLYAVYDKSKSENDLNDMFQFIFIFGVTISMYIIAVMIPLGPNMLILLFDKPVVLQAYYPLLIFMVNIVMFSIPIGLVANAIKKPQIIIVGQLFGVINIFVGYLLARKYGAIGMAVATTLSMTLRQVTSYYIVRKTVSISIPWFQFAKLLCNSIILSVLLYILLLGFPNSSVGLAVLSVIVFIVIYRANPIFESSQMQLVTRMLPHKTADLIARIIGKC
jgi:O-antigen/teichoic acid export membrane protein